MNTAQEQVWWRSAVIYQVYPRSFQDSNNDGVGDLNGIRKRLSHLAAMGVDALWISPVYPSPMADFGYDISDYTDIHPLFGTLAEMEALIIEAHALQLRIILDLVPNHTSDQHSWFLESRSSLSNPKRDWYIWEDARPDGGPPNNWLSVFGGGAWEWEEHTGQYYYHAFLKEQPDLNWRNPGVRTALYDVMRFWLEKGVDGFRVDVMWHMIKDMRLRDNPVNPGYAPGQPTYNQLLPVYSTDQPEVHDIVAEMRDILETFGNDKLLIGEVYLPLKDLVLYYGKNNEGAHLPFNFQLITLPWEARTIAACVDEYEGLLPADAWPNWVLGNHDNHRVASRTGIQQARVAAMLLFTLRGTPTVYYGDEIGMRSVAIPPEEVKDPQGLNMPGLHLSRDPARTPMQWDASPYAGFSGARPWLPVERSWQRCNVAMQEDDPYSMLSLYKELIRLRKAEPALHAGQYDPVYADRGIMAFTRKMPGRHCFLIVLNMTHAPAWFVPAHFPFKGKVVRATIPEWNGVEVHNSIGLDGDLGLIIQLEK